MTDAMEIINNCRLAIHEGAPFVNMDKEDIETIKAALTQKPDINGVDVEGYRLMREYFTAKKEFLDHPDSATSIRTPVIRKLGGIAGKKFNVVIDYYKPKE